MTLRLDGREVLASGSILDAVLAAGIALPHLCKDDHLPAIGACRTCLVEADGRVVAACSIPAALVAEVRTDSERVIRLRRGVLELTAGMQGGRPPADGRPASSEAGDAYANHGVSTKVHDRDGRERTDTSNTFFSFYEDECILCGRCTTACQSLQHIGAIGMSGRGLETRVTPGDGLSFRDSICTSCGSCVAACPTSALRPKGGV